MDSEQFRKMSIEELWQLRELVHEAVAARLVVRKDELETMLEKLRDKNDRDDSPTSSSMKK